MSKVVKLTLFLLLFLFGVENVLFAQKAAQEEVGFVYKKEAVGGILFHTSGWGGTFRYGRQKTYKNKLSFGLDLVNLRHPKEIKVYNPIYEDGRGYYYGKLNSVLIARPSFGTRRIFFQKLREQGVELGLNWSIGPSFAFLKPVYLQILYPTNDPFDFRISEERYDPEIHHIDNIYGRASGLRGIGEMKIRPGGFVKAGLHFEYSPEEDGIKALEVGGILDVYPQELPQIANSNNRFYFLNLYVSILFGRKYF